MIWDAANGCLQCVLRDQAGIKGTIKNLWEDFHVREIGLDGTICQLEELVSTNDLRKARLEQVFLESGKDVLCNEVRFGEEEKQALKSDAHLSDADICALQDWLNLIRQYRLASLKVNKAEEDVSGEQKSSEVDQVADASKDGADLNNMDADESEAAATAKGEEKPSTSSTSREEDEIAQWGVTTEFLRRELGRCHCLLLGDVATNDKETMKEHRRELHDSLRSILPFVVTDTLTTGEAYELQNGKEAIGLQTIDTKEVSVLDGEAREAILLKRSFITVPLRTQFQKVKINDEQCVQIRSDELPALDANASGDDRFRFIRVVLRPAAIAWLLGRPLDTPALTRFNWFLDSRWPKDRQAYLHFVLQKSNRDTSEAISRIAQCIGCRPKSFGFAGTKDRRGVTCQWISGYKISIEQFKSAMTKKEWDRQLRCSNFEYKDYRLKLGFLRGNHFKLVIRDIPLEDISRIPDLCQQLADHGFINYFGLQRFGTGVVKTYEVGAALLSNKYEAAVRMILGDTDCRDQLLKHKAEDNVDHTQVVESTAASTAPPSEPTPDDAASLQEDKMEESGSGEHMPIQDVHPPEEMSENQVSTNKRGAEAMTGADLPNKKRRKELTGTQWYLQEGDISRALESLPRWCHNERLILKSLQQEPRSFVSALLRLTKSSLGLYCHAAQSLVWNAVVSERISKYGKDKVLKGDFVRVRELDHETPEGDNEADDDSMEEPADLLEEATIHKSQYEVIEVDSDEKAAEYSIFDVVLPLPGEDVMYPVYLLDTYRRCSKELLNLDLEDFVSDKHGISYLTGSYRPMLQRAEHVAYRILKPGEYDNESMPRKPLLASDADRLLGKEIAEHDTFTEFLKPLKCVLESPLSTNFTPSEHTEKEPTNTAVLLLSCSLPKASYLTCAIREIIEGDFSSKPPSTSKPTEEGGLPDGERAEYGGRGRGRGGNRGRGRGGRGGRGGRRRGGGRH